MLQIIGNTSDSNQNIGAALVETTPLVVVEEGIFYAAVRVSGLNGIAASLTFGVRLKNSSDVIQGEVYNLARAKLVVAATKDIAFVGPIPARRGDKLAVVCLSTNVLDSAVTIAVRYIEANSISNLERL